MFSTFLRKAMMACLAILLTQTAHAQDSVTKRSLSDSLLEVSSKKTLELEKALKQLTDESLRKAKEDELAFSNYKTVALERLGKIKAQYLEGSDVLINIIQRTNDLEAFTKWGEARSSYLLLVDPNNYADFKESMDALKAKVSNDKKPTFLEQAGGFIANLSNFVMNPPSLVPGILSMAKSFGVKSDFADQQYYKLDKSISFITTINQELQSLNNDDRELNQLLSAFSTMQIGKFSEYYNDFDDEKTELFIYEKIGHPETSQAKTKKEFTDRVTAYFDDMSKKINGVTGGLETLKATEQVVLKDRRLRFTLEQIESVRGVLKTFDDNRSLVIARVKDFKTITEKYQKAKNLRFEKENTLAAVVDVIKKFEEGAFNIQNASRQVLRETL